MTQEYQLLQQSIMIHFQLNPENDLNVCLRASEVKPKLDRFLTKKLGGREQVLKQHPEWVQAKNLNGVDIALRYRMTITCKNSDIIVYESKSKNREDPPPTNKLPDIFYGNMSSESNVSKKYGVFFRGGLTVKILCFNKELDECISKYIAEFFAVTNFGTMQDKGFGSFIVEDAEVDVPAVLKENYGAKKCYVIDTKREGDSSKAQNEIFDTIKQVYSIMKSGQNFVGRDGRTLTDKYIRSFIYVYMHEKHKIGNEKAFLKQEGLAPVRTTHTPRETHECHKQQELKKFRYVRALLGIGEKIEWIEPGPEDNKKPDLKRKEIISVSDVTKKKEHIERLPSPIFFKIIKSKIYLTADSANTQAYDRTFSFTNKGYKYGRAISPRSNHEPVNIQTLSTAEGMQFNMADFLGEFMYYYNRNIDKLRKEYKIKEV